LRILAAIKKEFAFCIVFTLSCKQSTHFNIPLILVKNN
jgi:hypothetical protein